MHLIDYGVYLQLRIARVNPLPKCKLARFCDI